MGAQRNNIGVIRLVLASMVIIEHSAACYDPRYDPLIGLFGTVGLGFVAVSMFLIISGWLIARSWQNSPSARAYLVKRVLRIYPAFLVAWVVSVAIGLWAHGIESGFAYWKILLLNDAPLMNNGVPSNGSLWTIAYEFRCYVVLLICGSMALFARRRRAAGLCAAIIAAYFLSSLPAIHDDIVALDVPHGLHWLLGGPYASLRLGANFAVGVLAYLYRDRLGWIDGRVALLGLAGTLAMLSSKSLAGIGVMSFGAAGLYWLAFRADLGRVQAINAADDISYGTYLYGWPVQVAALKLFPAVPWLSFAMITLATSWLLGWISWHALEKRAVRLGHIKPAPRDAMS